MTHGVHAITIQSDFHRACSALWKMEEHTLVVSNSLVDQTSYKNNKEDNRIGGFATHT